MPVAIRWDSSGASSRRPGGWAYHVEWSDGPTLAGMRELVDQLTGDPLTGDPPGITAADVVYVRTVQPLAVALVLLRTHQAGQPALASASALQQALDDTAYPERASDADRDLATRLGRLTDWSEVRMIELLGAHGVAALTGDLGPDRSGTVVPLGRTAGTTRPVRPE